jgi:hypothetical protein
MKFKVKPTNRVVNFKCELDCGGQCCTGITLALPAEIKNLYDKVPLVLTMEVLDLRIVRNDPKLSRQAPRFMPKVTMLEDNGDYIGDLCVFFDFAMGAWHSEKSCFLLKDGKCTVHGEHKPLKCKLLPIQPLSDERLMYEVYEVARSSCPGVKNMTEKGCCVYKDGKLCNKDDVKNLQAYYDTAAQTLKFNEDYFRFLWAFKDGVIIEQVKDSYLKELEKEDCAFPLMFEVPFFPMDIFLDQLGIEVEDYVDKQLDVMGKFKEYDPEGFEKSFIKRQYEILQRIKEAGYKPEA